MAEQEEKQWRAELPEEDEGAEEERLRRKWERSQELKNAQREKRLKEQRRRLRSLMILAVSAVVLIIVCAILVVKVFIPSIRYRQAEKLVERGEYAEAIVAYRNMIGYKDADVRMEEAIRLQAVKLSGKENVYYETSESAPWFSIGEQGNLKFDEKTYAGDWDNVVIPDVFDGILVTVLDQKSFSYCEKMTAVTISDCVLTIKDYAFLGCYGLKSVVLPAHLETVGLSAFEDCTSLVSVTVGEELTVIGASAFADCTALVKISLPDSVTEIGSRAFNDCSALEEVSIGNRVEYIGSYAFTACDALKKLYVRGTEADLPNLNRTGLEDVTVEYTN